MSLFICPLCHSPLQPALDTWHCNGSLHPKQTCHTFDVARQGYVNLLPVQQKKSKAPGDSPSSIIARQRFLQAGYYQPLQALVCEKIDTLLSKHYAEHSEIDAKQNKHSSNWLDIGCGEGYYTQAIAQTVDGRIDTLIAADISKPAVLAVAKASKVAERLWCQTDSQHNNDQQKKASKKTAIYPMVTSAANLPLSAHSMKGISSIFSPILPEAFAKLLADDGYLLIAKPDVGHLATVREALFDEVHEHDSDKFLTELAPYFRVLDIHYVSSALTLSSESLADLLTMTPYAYRAQAEKRHAILTRADSELFHTEAKFVLYVLQKT